MTVPGGRGTPKITLRIPPDLWARFGRAAAKAGTDRAALLRSMISWYLREADLPERPSER